MNQILMCLLLDAWFEHYVCFYYCMNPTHDYFMYDCYFEDILFVVSYVMLQMSHTRFMCYGHLKNESDSGDLKLNEDILRSRKAVVLG